MGGSRGAGKDNQAYTSREVAEAETCKQREMRRKEGETLREKTIEVHVSSSSRTLGLTRRSVANRLNPIFLFTGL